MSNPRIEVDVVANVAGLATGVSAATTQLNQLGAAAQSTAPKFEQLSKSTSRYNGIGIDFARVIQDAPFGIIGVGNNIQQLAQSFSALGNAGDSGQSKLKLAFKSIFSSGNLLVLAVSAITTVLTLYEKGAFKSADATEDLNKKLDEYREKLQGIAKANLEGIKNAQSEIANFKLLQAQAENTNISYEKRIEAVEKLKKQYPEYLKSLTNEQILTGNVGTAYDNLTASIIATAKAKAFQSQIGENALNQATLAAQVENNLLKIKELQIEKADVLAASEKQSARDKQDFLTRAAAIQSNINALEDQNKKNKKDSEKIDQQNLKLAEQINEKVSQGADFQNDNGKAIDANKEKLKQYSQGWDDFNLGQETARELQEKLTVSAKDYEKAIVKALTTIGKEPILPEVTGDNAWDQYAYSAYNLQKASFEAGKEIVETSKKAFEFNSNLDKIGNKEVNIKTNFEEFGKELADVDKSKLSRFVVRLADFNSQVNNIIQSGAQQTLGDFAFAIGDALASGGNVLEAAGGALLGGIASILNQLGQLAIGAGLAVEGIKIALETLNPVVAVAAGVALIALAGFVSNKAKSLSGRSKGGGGGGGGGGGSSVGTSGVGGGTSFAGGGQGGLFQQNKDLNGELVVRGQDLVYVFGQASDRINKG
jgi:hypothetical protein